MKTISKLLFFLSIFLLYFVVREAISFFGSAFSMGPVPGYASVVVVAVLAVWFLLVPLLKILLMPRNPGPVTRPNEEENLIAKRLKAFSRSPFLREKDYSFDLSKIPSEQYKETVKVLEAECDRIRRKYITRVFYGTTISQNGFLDAILLLTGTVRLIKETYGLYAGKSSYKDLFTIGKLIYYSTVVGGSEGVEFLAEELFQKLGADGAKGIPFLGKMVGSFADGFVNAALMTRVSLIAENYCKKTLIKDKSELYPKFKTIYTTTKHIVIDLFVNAKSLAKSNKSQNIFVKLLEQLRWDKADEREVQPEVT